jgi:hypothetical protein
MDPKTGLYSRAAQLVRSYPSEKGTVEQMVAFAKKSGLKPAELEHAGQLPTGPITREALANIFENRLPKIAVDQYGENPSYLKPGEAQERGRLFHRSFTEGRPGVQPLSDEERVRLQSLDGRLRAQPSVMEDEGGYPEDTQYKDYTTLGGNAYRERLLKLSKPGTNQPRFQSSHWAGHPDVLAHIRLKDRELGPTRDFAEAKKWVAPVMQKIAGHMGTTPADLGSGAAKYAVQNGLITPEEAATLTQIKGWRNEFTGKPGIGKRLLHVEELQSDWAQKGREEGFNTGEATKAYQDHIADLKNRFRKKLSWMGDEAAIDKRMNDTLVSEMSYALGEGDRHKELGRAAADERGKPPTGPYVTNTQHWTDLALKNVLREAALGDYDGIVFTPGQAQADRYGLEKQLDVLHYDPSTQTLSGGKNGFWPLRVGNVAPEDLKSHIGHDLASRLMAPENSVETADGARHHILKGEDLKIGGQGMKGYYDQIVPKSVLALARQHDPTAQFGEPMSMTDADGNEYQGLHLPMTDTMKQSILEKGFPAFKRGGRVGYAQGGAGDDDQNAGARPAAPAAAGAVQLSGGVRGGAGDVQASDEAPLEGLPQNVRIPLTGETIKAGPDPRIRAVARQYMAETGMPYNPPTKYAKVDPARAKRIADAYAGMKDDPNDPLTKASYDAMIRETLAQYQAAKRAGFKAEFWNPRTETDPYNASPRMAVEDVRKNHHMWVYPTYDGYGSGEPISAEDAKRNPMLQLTGEVWNGIPVTVNDIFRAVHDYFGHAKEGVGFRHDGEENAWRAHASMYSPLARMAMTTETRGQNSWLNFGPHGEANRTARTEDTVFAPQKVGTLPHWVHHEGAEDFMTPESIAEMARQRELHGSNISKALELTRRFTKKP